MEIYSLAPPLTRDEVRKLVSDVKGANRKHLAAALERHRAGLWRWTCDRVVGAAAWPTPVTPDLDPGFECKTAEDSAKRVLAIVDSRSAAIDLLIEVLSEEA